MHPAEIYLKELLFEYDCVTIPGIGGFIMQTQPSVINRAKNRITPPSRYPTFNSLLNHDDGLLISAISRKQHVSYREASVVAGEFAETCKERLRNGEKIDLEGIGQIYSGPEGRIQFMPSPRANFLPGAFGMEALTLHPLSASGRTERLRQKPADRKPLPAGKQNYASVKWTLILSVPVILFLLYGIIFPSSIQYLYTNNTGLVFDLTPSKIFRQFQKEEPALTMEIKATEKISIPVEPLIQAPEPKAVETPVTETKAAIQPQSKYYIIGGCFLSRENADQFLQMLISRGFEAEKAGTNNRGQIRISYKSFTERPAALSYLQVIKNEENPSAWLLKY